MDSEGRQFSGVPIIKGDKEFYYTSGKIPQLVKELEKFGIRAELSNNSEGFICNTLIYLLSKKISESENPIPFLFIHIPWTDVYKNRITLEKNKIMISEKSLDRVIETIIKYY